ncbi:hypothetical protein CesoFtcFv8_025009 [Champsocephalus esox]|uniref:Uncharacterized protein n=1 Tax=Champsocephalus esox TaxID=159716 RepID=A0AAN8B320_9TELE|nr:hypothetical protein CesoFtcFv8_025009 [Champsocephalus esox]
MRGERPAGELSPDRVENGDCGRMQDTSRLHVSKRDNSLKNSGLKMDGRQPDARANHRRGGRGDESRSRHVDSGKANDR